MSINTSAPNALLHAYSSISGATILNLEGTNGSLFSVVDNLSGSLMSVNNNAGLPVFEVFSDDRVIGGRFGQNDWIITSGGNIGIGTGVPSSKFHVVGTSTFNGDVSSTGSFIAGSGSAANPSFEFTGDVDTGLFSPAANTFGISTSGVERLRVDSVGRVGIGTTSPSSTLQVSGLITANSGNFIQSLQVNGTGVSISGHTHTSSDITNFNSTVSGLLPKISNSGQFRILTSDGTSTGVNAESKLTFNYGVLQIQEPSSIDAGGLNLYNSNNGDTAVSIALIDSNNSYKLRLYSDDDTESNELLSYGYPLNIISYNAPLTLGTTGNPINCNTVGGGLFVDNVKVSVSGHTHTVSNITNLQTSLDGKQALLSNIVTGTGTSNYHTKWTTSSGIVNSLIYDDGTSIGINTVSPSGKFHIESSVANNSYVLLSNPGAVTKTHIGIGNSDTLPFLASTNNIQLASGTYGWGFFDRGADGALQIQRRSGSTSWVGAVLVDRSNGNVGIGTGVSLGSSDKLTVDGNIKLGDTAGTKVQFYRGGGTVYDYTIGKESNHLAISTASDGTTFRYTQFGYHASNGTWNPKTVINGFNGNVGVGTTSPNAVARLTIAGSGNTSGSAGLSIINSSSTNILYARDDGNIGIGTTTPQELLHVSGTISSSAGNLLRLNNSSATSNPSINFRIGGVGNYDSHFFISRNGTDVFGIDTNNRGVFLSSFSLFGNQSFLSYNNASALIKLQNTTTNDLEISAVSGILFQSQQSTKMRMDQSGNFGIGTTTPSGQLHVIGTGLIDGRLSIGVPSSLTTPSGALDIAGTVFVRGSGNNISRINLKSGSIADDQLCLRTDTNGNLYVDCGGGNLKLGSQDGQVALNGYSTNIHIGHGYNANTNGMHIRFAPGNTELMRMTCSGTIGIGLPTTSNLFNQQPFDNCRLHIMGSGANSSSSALNVANSGNSSLLFVRNDGNVGIGTTSPTHSLHVVGSGLITNGLNVSGSLSLNGSGVGLYDTSVFNLGTISGTNAINCGQDRQIQTLTLNGTATTFTTGTGWPTSSSVARETTLNIFASGNTSITWTIVNDWYRQPDSPLPSGKHIVLLRSIGSGNMQGHYIGNKTN
jgi:hypothetical protein